MAGRRDHRRDQKLEKKAEKKRGLLHYLGVGLSLGALALVLLVAGLAVVVPAITGSTPMTILTGSMQPKYPPGTLVIVKPTDIEQLKIGDVVTYQLESGKPDVVTHRVVAITSTDQGPSFTTRGDNNPSPDPNQVLPVQIRGTVWYAIPYLGYANVLINGQYRPWVIGAIVAGLFGYAVFMFVSGVVGSTRSRRRLEERERAAHTAAHASVL